MEHLSGDGVLYAGQAAEQVQVPDIALAELIGRLPGLLNGVLALGDRPGSSVASSPDPINRSTSRRTLSRSTPWLASSFAARALRIRQQAQQKVPSADVFVFEAARLGLRDPDRCAEGNVEAGEGDGPDRPGASCQPQSAGHEERNQ